MGGGVQQNPLLGKIANQAVGRGLQTSGIGGSSGAAQSGNQSHTLNTGELTILLGTR